MAAWAVSQVRKALEVGKNWGVGMVRGGQIGPTLEMKIPRGLPVNMVSMKVLASTFNKVLRSELFDLAHELATVNHAMAV